MAVSEKSEDPKSNQTLRVAIIGAGVGGLVLAQLLRNNPKFSVTVYERGSKDVGISSLTGFRILLSKEMLAALRSRLPKSVTDLLEKSVGIQPPGGQSIALLDENGDVKLGLTPKDFRDASSVSRWKLREALLEGLDDSIHWQTEYEGYESCDGVVKLKFKDEKTAECDVVVGADGAGSKIRKQLLPTSKRNALGVTVLYFKMPYTRETELMMPYGSGCMIMAPRSSMVVSYYKDKADPYGSYDLQSVEAQDSYLMCGLGCYTEDYVKKGKHPDEMTPEELKAFWMDRTKTWNPLFRSLIGITIPQTVYVNHTKTQQKMKQWKSTNVALLGDAAHRQVSSFPFTSKLKSNHASYYSMTPYLGKGATSAIFDALTLAEHLEKLTPGNKPQLASLLDDYTKEMLKSGFKMQKMSKTVHDAVFFGSSPFKAKCRNGLLKTLGVFIGSKEGSRIA